MWNLKNKEELKDKTFVITTNDMNLLHFADQIIYISQGVISFQGDFLKLQNEPLFENLKNQVLKNQNEVMIINLLELTLNFKIDKC